MASNLHVFGSEPYIPDEAAAVVTQHLRDGSVTIDKLHSGLASAILGAGTIWYVDVDNGSDSSNDGLSWSAPFATIAHAISEATAGDTIIVMTGTYEENVAVNKDYLNIIGARVGYGKPDIAPTSSNAWVVTGQGCVFANLRIAAPAADVDLVIHRSNGCKYLNVVFDGDSTQGDAKGLVRLKGVEDDDSYTSSENYFRDCLFRGSGGAGLIFDVGDGAGNQVGATHNLFENCDFVSNDQVDVLAADTSAGGVYSAQDNVFKRCSFGLGTSKNKATHIDLDTTNGASNERNAFIDCFINDDTVDTTAIQANAAASNSFIGLHGLDGDIDTSGLD